MKARSSSSKVGWLVWAAFALLSTGINAQTLPPRDSISDSVGATLGKFAVTETGNATYTIPLFTVPGTAGVVPTLALTYSTQGGDGPLGVGWSVSGSSSITRCRQNREAGDFIEIGQPVDGNPQPLLFGADDRFCLDGQRLLVVSGSYGANGATYRTELNQFALVTSFGGVAADNPGTPENEYTGPQYFTVQRKDGSTAWYGNSTDSKIERNGCPLFIDPACPSRVLTWALNRTQDSSGNYVTYAYVKNPDGVDSGEFHLAEVQYTGKTTLPGQAGVDSAPYARVLFTYGALSSPEQKHVGFQGGSKFTQSRQLLSISSQDQLPSARTLRYYKPTYGFSPSGSGARVMTSLKECRDETEAVCYPPTQFILSAAVNSFAAFEDPTLVGDTLDLVSQRTGDVDGDGRLDIVWFQDVSATCGGSSRLLVSYADRDESGGGSELNLVTPSQAELCSYLTFADGELDSAWGLIDFNGDGRDDLIIADDHTRPGARWHVYPSMGRPNGSGVVFDQSNDLINVTLPTADDAVEQAQLGDFNADGLLDIVYLPSNAPGEPSSAILAVRFLQRKTDGSGLEFSPPRRVDPVFDALDECFAPGPETSCAFTLYNQRTPSFNASSDMSGDGRGDLQLRVTVTTVIETGAVPPGGYFYADDARLADLVQRGSIVIENKYWYYFAMAQQLPLGNAVDCGGLSFTTTFATQCIRQLGSGRILITGIEDEDARRRRYADVNGDGLSDVIAPTGVNDRMQVTLNRGDGSFVALTVDGVENDEKMQVVDVTGDGRADLVYPPDGNDFRVFVYRSWVPTGGPNGSFTAEATVAGGGAYACPAPACNINDFDYFFADFDADGALDFVRRRNDAGLAELYVSRAGAASRYRPRDLITAIVNGNGAVTQLTYQPLTNKAIYRRDSHSVLMPAASAFGRGSPVLDLLAPIYVVSQVASSAPQRGVPGAQSLVHYRYAGAKIQAGGRGFLGFREVVTFDANFTGVPLRHILGKTTYLQYFPFIGSPARSDKFVETGAFVPDPCRSSMEAAGQNCFYVLDQGFVAPAGKLATANLNAWDSTPPFSATLPQQPIFQHLYGADEYTLDIAAGGKVVTSRVISTFTYDGNGNVSTSAVEANTGAGMGAIFEQPTALEAASRAAIASLLGGVPCVGACVQRKETQNVYADDIVAWRLGRLDTSFVTSKRPGLADNERLIDFDYDLSSIAKTGLLTSEHIEEGGAADQNLETRYQLDVFGNRTVSVQCSADVVCDANNLGAVKHRPINADGTPSASVHRYVKTVYDALGRFAIQTLVPYYNGGSGNGVLEAASQMVLARDEFGNVTQQRDANGVESGALYGALGRPYFAWVQTGATPAINRTTTTTLRWCLNSPNPAAEKVSCPPDASFRTRTLVSGGAATFTYFDVLGRAILNATESFNTGQVGKDYSAMCSYFDAHGRTSSTSEPFFLTTAAAAGEPNFAGNYAPCDSTAFYWTASEFDILGRASKVTQPDGGTMVSSYSGLTTQTTNARTKTWSTTKNAADEVIATTDPDGTLARFTFDAAGSLTHVCRDAIATQTAATACPSVGSGTQIVTAMTIDRLGRKIQQTDSDAGTLTFAYNAAGELIRQIDNKGQIVEQHWDALGRVWRRVSRTPGGCAGSDTIFCHGFETVTGSLIVDQFEHDTAANGLGALRLEDRSQTSMAAFRRNYAFDTLGRPSSVATLLDGSTYTQVTGYDSLGRVNTQQDVSGDTLTNNYSSRGFVESIDYSFAGAGRIYALLETNARGQVVSERRGNSSALETTKTYAPATGRLDLICSGVACRIQDLDHDFDLVGNLTARERDAFFSPLNALREEFVYDNLDRLTTAQLTKINGGPPPGGPVATASLIYDRLGNICSKNGQAYAYAGRAGCAGSGSVGSPHAVTAAFGNVYSYDGNGNQLLADASGTANDRRIAFDPLDQAIDIAIGAFAAPSSRITFAYGPDKARYKRVDVDGSGTRTTRYLGSVERITLASGVVETKRYLGGVALLITRSDAPATLNARYLFVDHLGSVEKITDPVGTILDSMSFDAHGARRDIADWQGPTAPQTYQTTRGYTGHEEVDAAAIVHMNGRLYDPALGRFLQADPVVQNPGDAQAWNRYTYVDNNPLTRTDPTGYTSQSTWRTVIALVITLYTGGLAQPFLASNVWLAFGITVSGGALAGGVASGGGDGALWGAFSAALFFGVGQYFDSAQWAQAESTDGIMGTGLNSAGYSAKVLAHGVSGGIMQDLQGGKFGNGFAAAGVTQALSGGIARVDASNPGFSFSRVTVAALVGGTVSAATGGKFANGALTAAFSRAFNDELSQSRRKNAAGEFETMEPAGLTRLRSEYPEIQQGMDAAMEKSTGWLFPKENGVLGYEKEGGDGFLLVNMAEAEWRWTSMSYGHIPFAGAPAVNGYNLRLIYHTHPFEPCYSFCGFSRQPYGPSPGDQYWARVYPEAYSVVRQLDRPLYYGPTAIPPSRSP